MPVHSGAYKTVFGSSATNQTGGHVPLFPRLSVPLSKLFARAIAVGITEIVICGCLMFGTQTQDTYTDTKTQYCYLVLVYGSLVYCFSLTNYWCLASIVGVGVVASALWR